MKPRLCLNMIVKDEAHVIERCLRSVLPFIDSWAIVDTGSTDGTQDLIRTMLADKPGELVERAWVDFSHNRNEALAIAAEHGDYALLIDADDELVNDGDGLPGSLDADAYDVEFHLGDTRYRRTLVIKLGIGWEWRGVLHEALYLESAQARQSINGVHILERREGARSKRSDVEKYAEDAATLIKGLKAEPDNSRYVFYLAQSYRDSLQIEKALRTYLKRSEMGGWDEEVWYSLFQAAVLSERLGLDRDLVTGRYLRAHQFRPTRAEALTNLARFHREHGAQWSLAHLFASAAIAIDKPADILFLDDPTYRWRAKDEYAIACYWTGRYRESVAVCQELLASGVLPEAQRARVTENLNFGMQRVDSAG